MLPMETERTTEDLSDSDRNALRKALEKKRDELLRARSRNLAIATTPDDDSRLDEMEAAARATDEAEALGLASHERALLGEIDHALGKFSNGTYGLSELTGRPIPVARLRAIPWARLAADEAESRERRR